LIKDSELVIIFKKVKAHQSEPKKDSENWYHWYGNDRADNIAKLCAQDLKTKHEETNAKNK